MLISQLHYLFLKNLEYKLRDSMNVYIPSTSTKLFVLIFLSFFTFVKRGGEVTRLQAVPPE